MLQTISKLAVVTGASKGIGASIARELSEAGYGVLLLARSAEGLADVAGYLQAEGGTVFTLAVDLSDSREAEKINRTIDKIGLPVSVLIHNAGMVRLGTVRNLSLEDWQTTLHLNLTAPFWLTKTILPYMMDGSQIIFINSIGGKQAFPEWSAYCASKFGLRALAESLRAELENEGIRVTSIFPGSVDTPLHDDLPLNWQRDKMIKATDIGRAVLYILKQPGRVRINELELESSSGRF